MNPTALYQFLEQHGIRYERHDHPAVFTFAESQKWVPPLPGAKTKNLFLRDRKGRRHFLVTVAGNTAVDLKGLRKELALSKLALGSPDRLLEYLGVTPGSVSILSLFLDRKKMVELLIDQSVWEAPAVHAHPLVNTSTLLLTHHNLTAFLTATGHQPQILRIPRRQKDS